MAELEAEHGIVKIDGREATSVGYTRKVGERVLYDLTFKMGKDVVQRVAGLTADEMLHAVGEGNARAIHQNPADRATLSGKQLQAHDGLSPDAQEAAISAEVDRELAGGRGQAQQVGAPGASEASENAKGVEDHVRDRLQAQLPTLSAEEVAARREAQMAALNKQFIHMDNRYFYKDRGNKIAFEDRGGKIVTAEKDGRVAAAMAQMAEAKGWTTVKVSGAHEFKRQLWLEASARGLKVQGYAPKAADLAALQQLRDARSVNSIERGQDKDKAHGRDAQNRNDEPTKEAIAEKTRQKQRAEDYNQLRPEGREAIGKAVIMDRVAGAITELKVRNPETRDKVMKEVRKRLDQMASGDKVPTLHTYDRNAPAKAVQIDKARPPVERNVERTR